MSMEHLTGQRESNLIRLQVTDLRDDGIPFPPQKRGRPVLIEWSEALTAVVDRAKARRASFSDRKVVPLNLLLNERGDPITVSGLQSAFRRLWARYAAHCEGKAITSPVRRITLHDLRAKAGSDTGNERMLGHKNVSTFRRIYDRKPVRAKPSK